MMTYGELLKKLRIQRKLSQKELTSEVSSQTALSRMESGDDVPFNLLLHFLRKLNIRAVEFFAMAGKNKEAISPDIDSFLRTNKVERCSRAEMERLVKKEMALFNTTGLLKHQVNAFSIRAAYCKIHHLFMVDNTNEVKNYLLQRDSWAINDISLYISLLFIFENDFIKMQHRRMLKFLANSPLEKTRKHFYEITYANNAVILAFERKNLADLDLYLDNYRSSLGNDLSLLNEQIRYAFFVRLKKLMLNFNEPDYQDLLKEIKSLQIYGLTSIVENATSFVNACLASNLSNII